MFTVNTTWDKSKGDTISPLMPDKCCHCLRDASGTVTVEEDGIKLDVPYCDEHISMAKSYYEEYYKSPKRKYIKYFSWILAPVASIIFIFYSLPESNIITGKDDLIKMFADSLGIEYTPGNAINYAAIPFWIKAVGAAILAGMLLKVIPYLLDKWLILHKGAHNLGFWKNRYIIYIVPGLTEIKKKKNRSEASTIDYSVSFSTRNFYDLFKEKNGIS